MRLPQFPVATRRERSSRRAATLSRAVAFALVLAALTPRALAHDGPPYPILVDEAFGSKSLSVWADPDVGVGTFYLYLPDEETTADGDTIVAAIVEPADGHLPPARHLARRADSNAPYQRIVETAFDRRGPWHVRFVLENGDQHAELARDVDVTPAGLGRFDILWFLAPFLLVGFLWFKVLQQKRRYAASAR